MLRTDIQRLIDSAENSQEASGLILAYLEDEGFSLAGNGWLDDDPNLMTDDGTTDRWNALFKKQTEILQALV
jgi:hypothetical protein